MTPPIQVMETALDKQAMLAAAERSTGLNNWGTNTHFHQGLEKLIAATEAMKPSSGVRAAVYNRALLILTMKLRLVEDEVRHPDILASKIEKPLIVVGLPRTGTTILFDLLALDPRSRSPREWEVFLPWPAPEASTFDTDSRIDLLNAEYARMLEKSPGMDAIQRMDARQPSECNYIDMHHFASLNFPAEFGLPEYENWLIHSDVPGLYESHKRILQQLAWKGPGGNWLLKAPSHMFRLEALLSVYPDAQLVWTHRDPCLSMSSIGSLIYAFMKTQELPLTKEEIGRGQWNLWRTGLLRGLASRQSSSTIEQAIFDVPHREVATDPVGTVQRIYEHFGREFHDDHAALINDFMVNSPAAARVGKHKHTLEEYGLDKEIIRSELADYYRRFEDYCRPPQQRSASHD